METLGRSSIPILGPYHEELMKTLDEGEDRLGANNGARMLMLGLRLS